MSQSAVQKPSLKPQTASNAGVEVRKQYPLQQTLSRAAEKATTTKDIVTSGEVN